MTIFANVLVQPLTGDDLAKNLAICFAGITAVIWAVRGKAPVPPPVEASLGAQLAPIHNGVQSLLLATQPPGTSTTTTVKTPAQTLTTTTETAPLPISAQDTVAGMVVDGIK